MVREFNERPGQQKKLPDDDQTKSSITNQSFGKHHPTKTNSFRNQSRNAVCPSDDNYGGQNKNTVSLKDRKQEPKTNKSSGDRQSGRAMQKGHVRENKLKDKEVNRVTEGTCEGQRGNYSKADNLGQGSFRNESGKNRGKDNSGLNKPFKKTRDTFGREKHEQANRKQSDEMEQKRASCDKEYFRDESSYGRLHGERPYRSPRETTGQPGREKHKQREDNKNDTVDVKNKARNTKYVPDQENNEQKRQPGSSRNSREVVVREKQEQSNRKQNLKMDVRNVAHDMEYSRRERSENGKGNVEPFDGKSHLSKNANPGKSDGGNETGKGEGPSTQRTGSYRDGAKKHNKPSGAEKAMNDGKSSPYSTAQDNAQGITNQRRSGTQVCWFLY